MCFRLSLPENFISLTNTHPQILNKICLRKTQRQAGSGPNERRRRLRHVRATRHHHRLRRFRRILLRLPQVVHFIRAPSFQASVNHRLNFHSVLHLPLVSILPRLTPVTTLTILRRQGRHLPVRPELKRLHVLAPGRLPHQQPVQHHLLDADQQGRDGRDGGGADAQGDV